MDKMVLTGGQVERLAQISNTERILNGWAGVRIKRFVGTENGNGEVIVEHGPHGRNQTTVFEDGTVPRAVTP